MLYSISSSIFPAANNSSYSAWVNITDLALNMFSRVPFETNAPCVFDLYSSYDKILQESPPELLTLRA